MTSERQEQVERRLAQSRRLINEASDPLTKERIARFIGDLEQEQRLEDENAALARHVSSLHLPPNIATAYIDQRIPPEAANAAPCHGREAERDSRRDHCAI